MKGPEENISLQEDKDLGIETDLETTLEIVLEILQTEIEGMLRELIDLEINLEIILEIDQMIEQLEMAEMILDKNQVGIVNIVIKMVTLGKYCWEMQANAKKARRLKEMDDRDDDPSDTFNCMVSEDIISDDDLDDFIRNFSDMTELN